MVYSILPLGRCYFCRGDSYAPLLRALRYSRRVPHAPVLRVGILESLLSVSQLLSPSDGVLCPLCSSLCVLCVKSAPFLFNHLRTLSFSVSRKPLSYTLLQKLPGCTPTLPKLEPGIHSRCSFPSVTNQAVTTETRREDFDKVRGTVGQPRNVETSARQTSS